MRRDNPLVCFPRGFYSTSVQFVSTTFNDWQTKSGQQQRTCWQLAARCKACRSSAVILSLRSTLPASAPCSPANRQTRSNINLHNTHYSNVTTRDWGPQHSRPVVASQLAADGNSRLCKNWKKKWILRRCDYFEYSIKYSVSNKLLGWHNSTENGWRDTAILK